MPVIQPYFDPSFDRGTSFLVSYWSAFLGERSEMNKAIMKQRLAAADPSLRVKQLMMYAEQIGALEQRKAAIRQEAVSGTADVIDGMVRAHGQISLGLIQARTQESQAATQARMELNKAYIGYKEQKEKEMDVDDETLGRIRFYGEGAAAEVDPVAAYTRGIAEARQSADRGDASPLKKAAIAAAGFDDAVGRAEMARAAGDQALAIKYDQAASAIKANFFFNQDPHTALEALKGKSLEDYAVFAEGIAATGSDAERIAQEFRSQVAGAYGGLIGPSVSGELQATPVSAAQSFVPGVYAEPQQGQAGGATGSGQPALRPTPASRGPQASPGQSSLLETLSYTPGIDEEIMRLRAEQEALKAMPEPQPGDMFQDFRRNYLLETPFLYERPQRPVRPPPPPPRRISGPVVAALPAEFEGARPMGDALTQAQAAPSGDTVMLSEIAGIRADPDPASKSVRINAFARQLKDSDSPLANALYAAYERHAQTGSGASLLQDWTHIGLAAEAAGPTAAPDPEPLPVAPAQIMTQPADGFTDAEREMMRGVR